MAYASTGLALSLAYLGLRERLFFFLGLGAASSLFELFQAWVPGRSPNARDALASALGLTAGLILGASFAARLTAESPAEHPEKQREHRAEQEPGGERNVKGEIFPLDNNIARQPPKP